MVEGILHAPLTPGLSLRTFVKVSFVLCKERNTKHERKTPQKTACFTPKTTQAYSPSSTETFLGCPSSPGYLLGTLRYLQLSKEKMTLMPEKVRKPLALSARTSVFENTRLTRLDELIKTKRISRLFSPST